MTNARYGCLFASVRQQWPTFEHMLEDVQQMALDYLRAVSYYVELREVQVCHMQGDALFKLYN